MQAGRQHTEHRGSHQNCLSSCRYSTSARCSIRSRYTFSRNGNTGRVLVRSSLYRFARTRDRCGPAAARIQQVTAASSACARSCSDTCKSNKLLPDFLVCKYLSVAHFQPTPWHTARWHSWPRSCVLSLSAKSVWRLQWLVTLLQMRQSPALQSSLQQSGTSKCNAFDPVHMPRC